jgi:hypothetical protein
MCQRRRLGRQTSSPRLRLLQYDRRVSAESDRSSALPVQVVTSSSSSFKLVRLRVVAFRIRRGASAAPAFFATPPALTG